MSHVLRLLPGFYNHVEVVLWPLLGVVLAAAGRRKSRPFKAHYLAAAVVLVIFGATDFFEAETGNEWWHPRWLLLWKAACVAALLGILISGAVRKQRRVQS